MCIRDRAKSIPAKKFGVTTGEPVGMALRKCPQLCLLYTSITGTKDACQYRQELTSTGDVITTVSQNPAAIGYASLAALKDNVKAVRVDGVSPSEQTVKDGSYAVQRPFVLVTKDGTKLSDAAQKFFDFAVSSDAAKLIAAAGAVPVA